MTLTILNILIIVRFNRIAKKREHLKGPAVNRTPTTHKNGSAGPKEAPLGVTASPVNGGGTNNGRLTPVPLQQPRSVSPIACVGETGNGSLPVGGAPRHSLSNGNGNLLAVPALSGNGIPAILSADHVSI